MIKLVKIKDHAKIMKKILKRITFLGLLLAFQYVAFAQGGPTPDPVETNSVPVDGGLSLFAAAGLAYGAKKVWDNRKEKNKSF
jgi:hypothetical protein